MAKRNPRVGEYYVAHHDPVYVYKVLEIVNNKVKYQNISSSYAIHTVPVSLFKESFTRVPIA